MSPQVHPRAKHFALCHPANLIPGFTQISRSSTRHSSPLNYCGRLWLSPNQTYPLFPLFFCRYERLSAPRVGVGRQIQNGGKSMCRTPLRMLIGRAMPTLIRLLSGSPRTRTLLLETHSDTLCRIPWAALRTPTVIREMLSTITLRAWLPSSRTNCVTYFKFTKRPLDITGVSTTVLPNETLIATPCRRSAGGDVKEIGSSLIICLTVR